LFIAEGLKKLGFEGWKISATFTDVAKNILREKGPNEFRRIYGNYYIAGVKKGAYCRVEIRSKTKNMSS